MKPQLKIISVEPKASLNYLKGFEIHYEDKLGKTKKWELVSRGDQQRLEAEIFEGKSFSDGAMIVAMDSKKEKVVILKEYRVTAGKYVYMFPAGLVNEKEDIAKAAIREFKEETGMDFEPVYIAKERYVSVGMVNEKITVAYGYYSGEPSADFQEASEDAEIMVIGKEEAVHLLETEEVSIRTALILENIFKLNPFLDK